MPKLLMIAVAAWIAACPVAARAADADAAALRELAPTGKLRVGVGVGPVGSAFWTTKDPATGNPRGVTVDLGTAFAKKLGVPVEIVAFNSSGEVTEAAATGAWDVAFMPVDAERAKKVEFGPNYYLTTSSYLVAPGSKIQTLEEVDRPGVRVFGVANTTTIRGAERSLKVAKVTGLVTVDEIVRRMRAGEVDAIALGRESLDSLAVQIPGSRVLDGYFHATGTAIAVPKGKPAALAAATDFIEEAKASGTVRAALDRHGIKGPVAPAGSRL